VVANAATATMLERLGRRLAYLPTDGKKPADEALVVVANAATATMPRCRGSNCWCR
jgi:hypothetical protein